MASDDLPELDDDLFDFDELLRDLEQLDEAGPVKEPAKSAPATSAPAKSEPAKKPSPPAPLPTRPLAASAPPAPTHRPPQRPPPVAPRPPAAPKPKVAAATPAPAAAAAGVAPPGAQPAPAPAEGSARRFVLSRGVVLALGGLSALHLVVLFVVMQALGQVRGMVHDVGNQVASSSASVRAKAEDIAQTFDEAHRPVVAPRSEGVEGLERARVLLEHGENRRARETLYALLAVADRLPADTRHDVEARARFLIADTWRLESEAARPAPVEPDDAPAPDEEEQR